MTNSKKFIEFGYESIFEFAESSNTNNGISFFHGVQPNNEIIFNADFWEQIRVLSVSSDV